MTQLGDKDTQKLIKESVEEEAGQEQGVKGIGFGGFAGARVVDGDDEEVMEGANTGRGGLDKEHGERIKRDIRREDRAREERRRSRSRDDGEKKKRRHRHRDDDDRRRRHGDRSRSRSRDIKKRSRSRSTDRRPTYDGHQQNRSGRDARHRPKDEEERHNVRHSRHGEEKPRRRSRSRSPYQRQSRSDRRYT